MANQNIGITINLVTHTTDTSLNRKYYYLEETILSDLS